MDMNVNSGTTTIPEALTQADLSEAVRATAMLADITVSLWSGERSDAKLMDKIKADADAVGNVGKVIKNMLAGVDAMLKETKGVYNQVRSRHFAMTLPWVSDPHASRVSGPRLLPNVLFERYLDEMSKARRAALAQLDRFIDAYPDLVVQAKANLGTLADLDYPDQAAVRAAFRVSFDFEPIPHGTQFRGLGPNMLEKLSKGLATKQQRMVATATNAMWETVRERITYMVERLAGKDAQGKDSVFREATIENVRELLVLLPGWDVVGSGHAAEVVRDISDMLGGVDVKTLRTKPTVRQVVANQGQALVEKLNNWGV